MTTFTWKVFVISVIPELDGKQDIVERVQFLVSCDDPTLNIRDELVTFPMKYTEGQEFIPYNELTEALVLSWLEQRKEGMENNILARKNTNLPKPQEKSLPWAAPGMPNII